MSGETNRSGGTTRPEPGEAGPTGEARRELGETGARLAGEARSMAGAAGRALEAGATTGKERVADRVAHVAERLQGQAAELREDEAWLADLVDRGARQLGSLAEEMRQRDFRGMLDQVESFGRQQPALFTGAAVALGFALTRFARTSGTGQGVDDRSRRPGAAGRSAMPDEAYIGSSGHAGAGPGGATAGSGRDEADEPDRPAPLVAGAGSSQPAGSVTSSTNPPRVTP